MKMISSRRPITAAMAMAIAVSLKEGKTIR